MAQRPVCGDVIILQVGVNGEADLQIFHTWITANYRLIQRPECWLPSGHPQIVNMQIARNKGTQEMGLGCGQ